MDAQKAIYRGNLNSSVEEAVDCIIRHSPGNSYIYVRKLDSNGAQSDIIWLLREQGIPLLVDGHSVIHTKYLSQMRQKNLLCGFDEIWCLPCECNPDVIDTLPFLTSDGTVIEYDSVPAQIEHIFVQSCAYAVVADGNEGLNIVTILYDMFNCIRKTSECT